MNQGNKKHQRRVRALQRLRKANIEHLPRLSSYRIRIEEEIKILKKRTNQ